MGWRFFESPLGDLGVGNWNGVEIDEVIRS
jgi:hypothetical protein